MSEAREQIVARYLVETPASLEETAAKMAGEQSAGTFVRVEGETDELRARAGAVVRKITPLGEIAEPSLAGSKRGTVYRRGAVEIAYPFANFGPNLPAAWTTVAGNLFELSEVSALRLLDVELPPSLVSAMPGPEFGIPGTRDAAQVYGRPILGTIVKPSVGLSPQQTADLARRLFEAGLDFVKDDELQADGPFCPFDERVRAVMAVVRDIADRTGRRPMFAFNLMGEVDDMKRRHDLVLDEGGSCVMVNLFAVGLTGVLALRRHSALPIHGHRAGWGLFYRSPHVGIDYPVWQAFFRLAGADQLHVNGLRSKFAESDESVVRSARACQAPIGGCRAAMPVFSSGQTIWQAEPTLAQLGNDDLMFLAGGGVLGHPQGAQAGVESLVEAWAAAKSGEPIEERAKRSPALAAAMEAFPKR